MVNIFGDKVVQKIVGKFFWAKGFFVNMDMYFQNMAIQLGKLLKTTYRSAFRRAPLKDVPIRLLTYQKARWSTF